MKAHDRYDDDYEHKRSARTGQEDPAYEDFSYDHKCLCCDNGFDSGYNFNDDKFCQPCVQDNNHIEYYKEQGMNDRDIYDFVSNYSEII